MHLTSPNAVPEGEVDLRAATLRQLDRLLTSEGFAKAERMRRFLTYAVERTLDGDLGQLKESVIGVEVFDRPPSYDPKSDPIVRIEARRLRDKLTQYYESDGKDDEIRISLPKGAYVVSIEVVRSATPVEPVPEPEAPVVTPSGPSTVVVSAAEAVQPARRRPQWWILLATAALVLLAVGLAGGWYWWTHEHPAGPLAPRVFTTLPGSEAEPSISPDGSKVAFVWIDGNGSRNIYIQSVGNFTPVPVMPQAAGEVSSPVWSPSGKEIAFLRPTGFNRMGIFSVDLTSHRVTQRGEVDAAPPPVGPAVHVDWSPNGRYFVTTHRHNLVLISTDTGAMKEITQSAARTLGHFDPVFSPDGTRIAFRQALSFGVDDLFVVDAGGGPVKRLTYGNFSLHGHTWTPDGKALVYSYQRSLWRIPVTGGQPERLTDGTVSAVRPSSSRGGRLVFASPTHSIRIWRMPVNRPGKAEVVLSSTRTDVSPDVSPDGKMLAFRSDRSGTDEIWISRTDGTAIRRLTSFGKPLTGCPRWSPDGRQIAFDSRPNGAAGDIFVIDVKTGALRHLTSDPDDEVVPSWSHDGRFVYFSSDRTGTWQIWKEAVTGGPAVQVTRGGGFSAWESDDGQFVYYAKDRSGYGLWRVPVKGGLEEPVYEDLHPGMWGNWRIGSAGIVFTSTDPPYRLRLLNPKTGRAADIGQLPSKPMSGDSSMALSPDGQWLFVALSEPPAGDLFLVEGLR